jgi:hypothetical protein
MNVMGFDSGSISFQRFAVVGQKPIEAGDLLEKIKAHAFADSDIGLPEAVEYGWVGPQHTHDGTFDHENCVFNDCLFFAIRIDTNTPPASVKRAYQKLEEAVVAKGNPSGFISKQRKLSLASSKMKCGPESIGDRVTSRSCGIWVPTCCTGRRRQVPRRSSANCSSGRLIWSLHR